jgi:hypothetical protein
LSQIAALLDKMSRLASEQYPDELSEHLEVDVMANQAQWPFVEFDKLTRGTALEGTYKNHCSSHIVVSTGLIAGTAWRNFGFSFA